MSLPYDFTGKQLKIIRSRMNMSISELAAEIRVRDVTVSNWEKKTGRLHAFARNKIDDFMTLNWRKATDWRQQFVDFSAEKSCRLLARRYPFLK